MIEYLISNLWLLWLCLSIICLILELTSGDFFITCIAIGALVAMISSWISVSLSFQVLIFAIALAGSIFFVRPKLLRFLHKGGERRESNADALIGREGVVIEKIPVEGSGYIKVDGDEWRAVAGDNEEHAVGSKVVIVNRESIIMTVEGVRQESKRDI